MRGAHVEEREGVGYIQGCGSGYGRIRVFWSDPDPVRVLKFGPMEIRAKH